MRKAWGGVRGGGGGENGIRWEGEGESGGWRSIMAEAEGWEKELEIPIGAEF